MSFKVSVKSDLRGVTKKVNAIHEKMQFELDSQVLKDANYFLPKDTGNLEDSSIIASELGKGRLVWDTPYARRLYWNPQYNFSKDRNPNARGKWAEEAKAMYLNDWIKMLNRM
ncbi:MAG: minor capsid protein [Tetragenococcus koreensis]|nr:minor capsid protein [Tetragenococcus koreensis]